MEPHPHHPQPRQTVTHRSESPFLSGSPCTAVFRGEAPEVAIPYLPSVGWYRAWVRWQLGLGEAPALPSPPNRALIRGAWGEQSLVVPIEGGRKRLARTPYPRLRLSEHGDWRHLHWQALNSAYGSLPYFHYFEDDLAPLYTSGPIPTLETLCRAAHAAFLRCSHLPASIAHLKEHPSHPLLSGISSPLPSSTVERATVFGGEAPEERVSPPVPEHVTALELLFLKGPSLIFSLLA